MTALSFSGEGELDTLTAGLHLHENKLALRAPSVGVETVKRAESKGADPKSRWLHI